MTPSQAASWQTGTAIVQAVCSVTILGWYVLAAHLDRRRARREKAEDYGSLVRLCRDLGVEAREKSAAHRRSAEDALTQPADGPSPIRRLALWRADMQVIYVCLNEVPHYEVRNPGFSTALTRLWLATDARSIDASEVPDLQRLIGLLDSKYEGICREVDSMETLLGDTSVNRTGSIMRAGRRGMAYSPEGFVQNSDGGVRGTSH